MVILRLFVWWFYIVASAFFLGAFFITTGVLTFGVGLICIPAAPFHLLTQLPEVRTKWPWQVKKEEKKEYEHEDYGGTDGTID